jgi:hypothetical protein
MPYYQVRTMSVEFKAENRDLLDAALKALGWKVYEQFSGQLIVGNGEIKINLKTGMAEVQVGSQAKLNELKRAYSRQSINAAAKKAGWQVSSSLGVSTSGKLIKRTG